MEPIIVLIVGLVAAVPIGVIALAIRQASFSRRLSELESIVSELRSLLARQNEIKSSTVSSLLSARETTISRGTELEPEPQPVQATPIPVTPPPIFVEPPPLFAAPAS